MSDVDLQQVRAVQRRTRIEHLRRAIAWQLSLPDPDDRKIADLRLELRELLEQMGE